jgi:hypothetical protein
MRRNRLICEWKFEKKLDKGGNRERSELDEVMKRGKASPRLWQSGKRGKQA